LSERKLAIIIPAYNEGKVIFDTIKEIRNITSADIIVVNDGSIDDTEEKALAAGAITINLPFNLRATGGIQTGEGAVQTGLMFALRENYRLAVTMDADGQHDPSFIPILIKPLENREADLVIGSRYIENNNTENSFIRRLGIKFFSWLASKIVKQRITDCNSGFRAFNKKAMEIFAEDYPPDARSIIRAYKKGLKIKEVPIQARHRKEGKSSLRMRYYPFVEIFFILVSLIEVE